MDLDTPIFHYQLANKISKQMVNEPIIRTTDAYGYVFIKTSQFFSFTTANSTVAKLVS